MSRTAITINFPELANIVDGWRVKTVEVARYGIPPHITLLFPWQKAIVSEANIEFVASLCDGIQPFKVEFNELKYFDSGTVYLSPQSDQEILSLSRLIWARFPETPPYGGLHEAPIPHLTVAQGDAQCIVGLFADVTSDLANDIPYSCSVNEVSILEENTRGMWEIRANISLG